MLASFVLWPQSTIQAYFLFHPKIHIICILVVLLSRVDILETAQSNNGRLKQISGLQSGSSGDNSGLGAGSRDLHAHSVDQGKRRYGHLFEQTIEREGGEINARLSAIPREGTEQVGAERENQDAESTSSEPTSAHARTMGGSDVALVQMRGLI